MSKKLEKWERLWSEPQPTTSGVLSKVWPSQRLCIPGKVQTVLQLFGTVQTSNSKPSVKNHEHERTRSCRVSLPFLWVLPTPKADSNK